MTSTFQVDNVQLQVKASTEPFNNFDFVHQNLHRLSSFDFVLLKDNDIRPAGFEWNTFMDKKSDALISAPYHVRIEDTFVSRQRQLREAKMSASSVVSLQDGALFNTYRDANFQNVTSGPVLALGMFMVLMKPDFALWVLGQTLTSDFLKQHVDWGPDLMWCRAAHDYVSKTLSGNISSPCGLVSLNEMHADTKQIMKSKDFSDGGNKVLEGFRRSNSVALRRWMRANSGSRRYFRVLSDWCRDNAETFHSAEDPPLFGECLYEFHRHDIDSYVHGLS